MWLCSSLLLALAKTSEKSIHPLVDRVIKDFLMNIATFDMVLLEMSIKKPFRVMFPFDKKTKFQIIYLIT